MAWLLSSPFWLNSAIFQLVNSPETRNQKNCGINAQKYGDCCGMKASGENKTEH